MEFAVNTRKRRNIERGLTDRNYPGSSWKPKGALIAHLHEHKVISKLYFFLSTHTLLFLNILTKKNKHLQILPSGIARNSSAPNAKRIFGNPVRDS